MPKFSARVATIFTKKYRESQFEELISLKDGNRRIVITRGDVPSVLGTYHITAAKNLGLFLSDKGVTTVGELQRLSLDDFMVKGFGEAHLRVLLDLLDYVNVSVPSFCGWTSHSAVAGKKPPTFVAMKHRKLARKKRRR